MYIDDDHLYHGAALIQIAEDPNFTAINSLRITAGTLRNAYRINQDVGLYLKYATTKTKAHSENAFTFTRAHLDELEAISNVVLKIFIALVCVKDKQICCLSYAHFLKLISFRREEKGADEDQYVVLAQLPSGSAFRAYVNAPGTRNKYAGKQLKIARNALPSVLFS